MIQKRVFFHFKIKIKDYYLFWSEHPKIFSKNCQEVKIGIKLVGMGTLKISGWAQGVSEFL